MTRNNIDHTDEARVAPGRWKRALLAVLGIVTGWAWLLTQPPYFWSDSAAAGWWLATLLAGGLWAWFALWNTHRRLLALTGLALPAAMVAIAWQTLELRSALDGTGLPDQAVLMPASWLWAWAGLLAPVPLLVILAASWRLGGKQVRQGVIRRKAEAAATKAREAAERQAAVAAEQAEQERIKQRQQREEMIEEATARLASRVAAGDGSAGSADTDELAALALFQDQGRRDWKREAEEQRDRAGAAEARVAKAEEEIVKLRSRLRQEIAYDLLSPVTATIAGAASAVGAAGVAGGGWAGSRCANAFDKASGG